MELLILADYYEEKHLIKKAQRLRKRKPIIVYCMCSIINHMSKHYKDYYHPLFIEEYMYYYGGDYTERSPCNWEHGSRWGYNE